MVLISNTGPAVHSPAAASAFRLEGDGVVYRSVDRFSLEGTGAGWTALRERRKADIPTQESYDWGRFAISAALLGLQIVLFTYPPVTLFVTRCLRRSPLSFLKLDTTKKGTAWNIGLLVILELYNQSKKEENFWSRPSQWDPLPISTFILTGYAIGVSMRSIDQTRLFKRFGNLFGEQEFRMGALTDFLLERRGVRELPGFGTMFRYGWQCFVLNAMASGSIWLLSLFPYLWTIEAPKEKKEAYIRETFWKNIKWGWIRRGLAMLWARDTNNGAFYLINHGLMLGQQIWVIKDRGAHL